MTPSQRSRYRDRASFNREDVFGSKWSPVASLIKRRLRVSAPRQRLLAYGP